MRTEDQVVEYFNMTLIRAVVPEGTPMIMVYAYPDDYPGNYVARLYDGRKGTHIIALADTMEALREAKPERMAVIKKQEKDPPKVVETWL
jgi:hypothetical protein